MLRPFKYVVSAVVLDIDDDTGRARGEGHVDPVVFYSEDDAKAWIDAFPARLATDTEVVKP